MRTKMFAACALCALLLLWGATLSPHRLRADTPAHQVYLPIILSHAELPPGPTLRRVGQFGGQLGGIAARGSYAYVGVGDDLVTLDVSDPTRLRPVSRLNLPDNPFWRKNQGDITYSTTGFGAQPEGFHILDFANLAAPRVVGFYPLPGVRGAVAPNGAYGYVLAGLDVVILELAEPRQPREVGRYRPAVTPWQIEVDGSRLYTVDDDANLRVLDLTDPLHPRELGLFHDRHIRDLRIDALADGYAYVSESDEDWIGVMDVSDPAALRLVGAISAPEPAALDVRGARAYVSVQDGGLWVFDISDKTQPRLMASLDLPADEGMSLAVAGSTAYLAGYGTGVFSVDLAAGDVPVLLGAYQPPAGVSSVAVSGHTTYVGASNGLHTLDVTAPTSPTVLSRLDVAAYGKLVVAGTTLHALFNDHVIVLDVSDPRLPRQVTTYGGDVGSSDAAFVLHGDLAVLAGRTIGLYDVSDPSAPRRQGQYTVEPPHRATQLAVDGQRLYAVLNMAWDPGCLCYREGGLLVLDISDPTQPRRLGFLAAPEAGAVAVANGYAYLAYTDGGLMVVDVRDPAAPRQVVAWRVPTGQNSMYARLAVVGGYALVWSRETLHVLDVRVPGEVAEVRAYPVPYGSEMALVGDTLYLATPVHGLIMYRVEGGER